MKQIIQALATHAADTHGLVCHDLGGREVVYLTPKHDQRYCVVFEEHATTFRVISYGNSCNALNTLDVCPEDPKLVPAVEELIKQWLTHIERTKRVRS